jgi:hypothetical protein
MATSNSTNYSTDRNDLISGALRLVGAIPLGGTPTSSQISEASSALNMMVKAWQVDGLPLWAIKQYSLTLTASNSYEIGLSKTVAIPKPLKVIQAFLKDNTSNVDIPMRIITRDEYNRLGNKISEGYPIQIFYEPLLDYGVLHVYPKPNNTAIANKTLVLVYQRPFEDFDASIDEPDFPQEWYEAIKYGLASRLAGEYGMDLNERRELIQEANAIKEQTLGFGTEEGSFFIKADLRRY